MEEGPVFLPVVAAVLRDGRGRVLLARRPPGGPHGGLWELPGGKVEAGESSREAVARELREELGVVVAVGGEVGSVDHVYPHVAIRLTAYACTLVSGTPEPLQGQELAWVEPAGLLSRPMPAADRPLVRRLLGDGPDDGTGPRAAR
ncbi:MAG: (deoxy)nucleoside triphosphate pyrophosphohydrolase [Deferrisomatales bacterium]|nr:(deoxy)nucleoside triphosphate pyrophosphohydrolase [Deferrisomatales bacterium]